MHQHPATVMMLLDFANAGRRRKVFRCSSCSICTTLVFFVLSAAAALPQCYAFHRQGVSAQGAIFGHAMDGRQSHLLHAMRGGKPPRRERSKSIGHVEEAMLQHDMLTKAEEHALAFKIRRAQHLQAELEKLLLAQQQEHRQQQQQQQQNRQQKNNDPVSFIEEQHIVDRNTDELLLFPRDGLIEEDEEEDEEYDAPAIYPAWGSYDEFDNYQIWSSKSFLLENLDKKSLWLGAEAVDNMTEASGGSIDNNALVDDGMARQLGLADSSELDLILYEGAHARDVLIRCNLKLVFSISKVWARNYGAATVQAVYSGSTNRPSLSEAVQEGCFGLIQAVERFDPSRNVRFSTFATYYIINHVRRCFQQSSTGGLRVPFLYYGIRGQFERLVKSYYEKEGGTPSFDKMAQEMNVGERRLRNILRLTRPLLSTDSPISSVSDNSINEPLSAGIVDNAEMNPEDLVELSLLRQSLENAMATELAPFERDVLRLRLGMDDGIQRTAKEVAAACGGRVSLAEVRTTERRALKKLRSPFALATYKLMTYLDFAGVDRETINMP